MISKRHFTLEPIIGTVPKKMLPEGTALVLEGGGLRGFYSAGVFEAFMDAGIIFPYIIAVPAGAANVLSYVSGQRGRNRQVLEHFVPDKRYVSKRNLLRGGSLFGMNFVFHEVPRNHVVFDWDAFHRQGVRLLTGTLDCTTGRTRWFEKEEIEPELDPIIASCSVPILSPIRRFNGYELLDGGVSDPIPIEKSIADGNVTGGITVNECDPVGDSEFFSAELCLLTEHRTHVNTETADSVIAGPGAEHFARTAAEIKDTCSRLHAKYSAKRCVLFRRKRIVDAVSALSVMLKIRGMSKTGTPFVMIIMPEFI